MIVKKSADDQVLSHDTLPYVRVQGLHVIFQLLAGNAEQEQNLLRLGINKLVSQLEQVMHKLTVRETTTKPSPQRHPTTSFNYSNNIPP